MKDVAHAEREHADCSASGAEKWLACAGCPAMCRLVPPRTAGFEAKEGEQGHELGDKILKPISFHYNKTGDLSTKEFDMMDFTMFDNYPRDMWDYIRFGYADSILLNIKEYKPKKFFIEERVWLSKELQMFGTADCYFFFKKDGKIILSIWDLKYGKGKIVEPISPQLIYYAAAAFQHHASQVKKVDEVWLNVYQPRAEHPSGEVHRQHFLSAKELGEWTHRFLHQGKHCMSLIGKPVKQLINHLTPGDHCDWCDAMPICPAYKAYVEKQVGTEFEEVPALIPEILGEVPTVHDVNIEKLSKFLMVVPQIEAFCRNSKRLAITLMLAGTNVPGWKSVEGRTQRRFRKNQEGDVARGLVALGIDDPWKKSLRGIGEIVTELRSKKTVTKKVADKMIGHLVEMTEPKLTLALIDDPRPAITGDKLMAGEFDSLDMSESESFD